MLDPHQSSLVISREETDLLERVQKAPKNCFWSKGDIESVAVIRTHARIEKRKVKHDYNLGFPSGLSDAVIDPLFERGKNLLRNGHNTNLSKRRSGKVWRNVSVVILMDEWNRASVTLRLLRNKGEWLKPKGGSSSQPLLYTPHNIKMTSFSVCGYNTERNTEKKSGTVNTFIILNKTNTPWHVLKLYSVDSLETFKILKALQQQIHSTYIVLSQSLHPLISQTHPLIIQLCIWQM